MTAGLKVRGRGSAALAACVLVITALSACKGHANDFSNAGGGTTLTIQGDLGNPTLTANFNPYLTSPTRLGGALLAYEPLEIRSPINGSYQPFLATRYAFTSPTTLQYTLRTGVKWNDGKPFSVADVLYSFALLKKYPALDTTGIWAQVAKVTGSGDTVTVTFKKANVPFAGIVAAVPIVPKHIWSTVGNPTKFADPKPVGTGPFMISSFSPTGYTMKKNPLYWQPQKVAPAEVRFPAQSTNQSTNQLEVTRGAYDWSYQFVPNVKQTYVAHSSHNTYWFPPGGAICLFLNLTKAPYNDVHFRLGISAALNRQTIATKAVNGYLNGASQSGLILPNLKQWLDPSLPNDGNVGQNVAKAMSQFSQAGYTKKGSHLVNRAGKTAQMTLMIPSGYSDWIAGAHEVVTELGQVGVHVTLQLPQAPQFTQATQAGKFDAAFNGFGGTGDPYTDYSNALASTFATAVGKPTANNFERFKSTQVDSALATLARATSFDQQRPAAHTLEKIMYDQAPVITLYYGGSWGLFSTKNFVGWPSAANPYTLPTPYNNAMLVVLTHLTRATA